LGLTLTKLPKFDKTGMVGRSTRHNMEKDKSFKFNIGNVKGGSKESNLPNIHSGMQETSVQFMQKP